MADRFILPVVVACFLYPWAARRTRLNTRRLNARAPLHVVTDGRMSIVSGRGWNDPPIIRPQLEPCFSRCELVQPRLLNVSEE